MAAGLNEKGINTVISTTKLIEEKDTIYNLYVLVTNTYNWAPDWLVINYIEESAHLKGKQVVALTLRSGSTATAQKKLEKSLEKRGASVLHSQSLWLMKPNDEDKMEDKNTDVAKEISRNLGLKIGAELKIIQ